MWLLLLIPEYLGIDGRTIDLPNLLGNVVGQEDCDDHDGGKLLIRMM
jgi:hypothetical protein